MISGRCWLLAALAVSPAGAQTTPSPQQLNACTEVRDPAQLRDCLDRSAGVDERVPRASPPPAKRGEILRDQGSFDERDRAPHPSLLRDGGVLDRGAGPPP